MAAPPARPASTVVLLRPSRSRFDVFLVRRHENIAFMGGAHVFPGGRVDAADRFGPPDEAGDGASEAAARVRDVPPSDAVAYHVAAIRELFEEAGVLLARRGNGRMIDFADAAEAARFVEHRRALAAGTLSIRDLVARERLRLSLEAIVLFAHWVTPEVETKRFDTRFFVAAVPEAQEPVHDEGETTHSEWMDPVEAVERCRRDEIMLPPPTWTTLRELAQFASVDEVMRWARRREIVRVQPGFIQNADVTMLTLPGDPLHPPLAGFETPEETRFVLDGIRWRAVRPS